LYTLFFASLFFIFGFSDYLEYQRQYAAAKSAYEEQKRIWEAAHEGQQYTQPFSFVAKNENGDLILPYTTLRFGLQFFLVFLVIFIPTRKIVRTYGSRKLIIDDNGITIKVLHLKTLFKKLLLAPFTYLQTKEFDLDPMKTEQFVTWEGVLDIQVKKSESIIASIIPNLKKAVVYTMDRSFVIDSLAYQNADEIMEKMKTFGDSLEEKVIDFGYGASIAIIWRRMKRSKVGMLGFVLVTFFLLVAVFAAVFSIAYPLSDLQIRTQPVLIKFFSLNIGGKEFPFQLRNPNFGDPRAKWVAPNEQYYFGTDGDGRDIFSRIFFGSFYSILIGVIAQVIIVVLGGIIGAASGYMGGAFDNVMMRVADVLLVLPGLPILIMISAAFGSVFDVIPIEGAYYLVVYSIFALIGWPGTARYIRAEVLAIKEAEFIQAEYVLGATHWRTITRHIIPNAMSTLIIIFTLGIAGVIQGVASLAFLGFGSSDTLVWGSDLSVYSNDTRLVTQGVWWGVTFVSLALFLLTLGFNLLGDSLRDALDPTLKE
ncbi:MAG: ABC transporter permease, partial [Methanobacteriota archaeon]